MGCVIVSKERIRRTVAELSAAHPGAGEPELHHKAAASLAVDAETVRIVMQEPAKRQCAEPEN